MKTIYTATINLEISGDINRMTPEEIPIDHCDADDNTFYPLAFTSHEELDRHVAVQLIKTIENLMRQYDDCKLTSLKFRDCGPDCSFVGQAEMTYLDANNEEHDIKLSVYEEVFKMKE